jgi:hypothetical protein
MFDEIMELLPLDLQSEKDLQIASPPTVNKISTEVINQFLFSICIICFPKKKV